jgi:CheY-like chemotaxis protein
VLQTMPRHAGSRSPGCKATGHCSGSRDAGRDMYLGGAPARHPSCSRRRCTQPEGIPIDGPSRRHESAHLSAPREESRSPPASQSFSGAPKERLVGAEAKPGEGPRHQEPSSLRTIIVVDDDAEMGQAISRLLSAAGYRTTTFPSAEALLADEAFMRADCFILDIHLPGLSGFELRQRIAQRGVKTPVIFITAYDDAATRKQAQAAGAVALFTKPFRAQPMLAAIAGALAPI